MKDKDNTVLVSIICDTFNHEMYIRQCLDGFITQKTDFLFEVLIHDDASTDGTADIIREYKTEYPDIIKPIYQTENQYSKKIKIWEAYQFPRAKGKYIALCEGDDYWTDPYKLQKQVDFMEKNPDYGMVFTNTYHYIEKKKKLIIPKPTTNYNILDIFNANPIRLLTVLFEKHSLLECSQYLINNNTETFDYPIFLWFSNFSKIHCLTDITGVYRIIPNSMTHSKDIDKRISFQQKRYKTQYFAVSNYDIEIDKSRVEYEHYYKCYTECLLYDKNKQRINEYKKYFKKNNVSKIKNILIRYSLKNDIIEFLIIKTIFLLRNLLNIKNCTKIRKG